jgi:hypothetical protein
VPHCQLLDNLCKSGLHYFKNRCFLRDCGIMLRNVLFTKLLGNSRSKSLFYLQILFSLDCLKEIFMAYDGAPSLHISVLFQLLLILLYCEHLFCVILLDKISSNVIAPKKVKLRTTNFCRLDGSGLGNTFRLCKLLLREIIALDYLFLLCCRHERLPSFLALCH